MKKTTFAGLTELDISESLLEDNGAFTGRDRETIDRFLQIGAKTHRHNGAPGLTNPTAAPSAAVLGSGGTIEAELSMSIGYTAQDGQQGETLLSPVVTVTTPGPLDSPQHAPSAEVNYDAGSLTQDNYYYGITYLDDEGGETPLGPVVSATRQPGYVNARVLLSHINAGMAEAGAKSWRLYRQRAGGVFAFLASGTGAEYTDEGIVSAVCDLNPPNDNFNTTNSINRLMVSLPELKNLPAGTEFINVYLSQSGNFSGQTFLEQFPVSSAGGFVIYEALELNDDQPPDTNTSVGGADKIDPDTELEDWPWLRPVANAGALTSAGAEPADVRVAKDTSIFYVFNGVRWQQVKTHRLARQASGNVALVLEDDGGAVEVNAPTNGTLTIPDEAVVNFPLGAVVEVSRFGAGHVGIKASGGVTLNSKAGASAISSQYGVSFLRKRGPNEWLLYGDIS